MLLQISTLKFWINLEPLDYFRLIGMARGGRSDQALDVVVFHWAFLFITGPHSTNEDWVCVFQSVTTALASAVDRHCAN
jgi:hypothetical protein